MAENCVALVTGANRGIGLEIVRQLSRQGVLAVIGARDRDKGAAAAKTLMGEGLEVPVVGLDVTAPESIVAAVEETVGLYERVDILVNNAAVLLDSGFHASLFDMTGPVAMASFETNVLGPARLIQAVVPVMRRHGYGRIVNLSSGAGQLADMRAGYPAYRMSKTALNALTRIAAAELQTDNIKVNAVCPGWVRTDMGGPQAERPVEQGAETPVWLAMLPDDGPTGGFFRDKKPIDW